MKINARDESVRTILVSAIILLVLFGGGLTIFSQNFPEQDKVSVCQDDSLKERLKNVDKSIQKGYAKPGEEHLMKTYLFADLDGDCEEYWKKAVDEFELAVKAGYDSILLRTRVGNLFLGKLKNYAKAIEQYQHVVNRQPRHYEANLRLAVIYLKTENWERLLERSKVLMKIKNPLSADFYLYYEARALEGLRRYPESSERYKRFLKYAEKNGLSSEEVFDAERGLKEVKKKLLNSCK